MVLKGIDHIGIMVDNLDETVALMQKVFGLPITRTIDIPDRGIKGTFLKVGDCQIELIQPTTPEVRKSRLGEGVQARIEHIAAAVDDVEKAYETLKAAGLRFDGPPSAPGGAGRSVFVDASTTAGIRFQLYEPTKKG